MDAGEPQAEYELLRRELEEYSAELAEKPHCIVFSKADLLGPGEQPPSIPAPEGFATFVVSGVARSGLQELAEGLWKAVRSEIEREEGTADSEPNGHRT